MCMSLSLFLYSFIYTEKQSNAEQSQAKQSKAKHSKAKPSKAKPRIAEPSQAKQSQAKQSPRSSKRDAVKCREQWAFKFCIGHRKMGSWIVNRQKLSFGVFD